MQVSIEFAGKRGKKYQVRFSLDSHTNNVFIELLDSTHQGNKKHLASVLEARGGAAGRLLAGWFGSDK